ncbi:MAG: hypothetical protein WC670_09885 [Pseudolabrys sp.]|jgi:hypothetical protein
MTNSDNKPSNDQKPTVTSAPANPQQTQNQPKPAETKPGEQHK